MLIILRLHGHPRGDDVLHHWPIPEGEQRTVGRGHGEGDKRYCPEGVELASVEISSAGLSGKTRHSIGVGAMSRLCTCAVLFY